MRHRSGVRTGRFSQGLHLQPPSLRCAELLCRLHGRASVWAFDTAAFNFDRVVALYGNLGKEQQRGFLSDVNIVGGGLLRSLSRTLAVQSREPHTAEYAVAVPSAKKPSRQQERG